MKKTLALFLLVVLCASAAFAATGHARLDVRSNLKIADKTIVPGEYTVMWTGEGENVEVVIKKGKKNEIVKTTAKLVQQKTPAGDNFVLKTNDGVVKEMYFVGQTASLVF